MPIQLDVMYLIMGLAIGAALTRAVYNKYIRDHDKLTAQVQDLLQKNVRLDAEKQSFAERVQQHKTDLDEMEKKFSLQFENLANKIFTEKSDRFRKESQENIGLLLTAAQANI